MATKRKKNSSRRPRSKEEMLNSIYSSFAVKAPITYVDRVKLAQEAYKHLDNMMKSPCFQEYKECVDVMNLFVQIIHSTDTKKKCFVRHKCENAHEWLFERVDEGEPVAQTINECQRALENTLERFNRTGSWALDARTITLLEKCFQWYEWTTSVMPRAVLADCIDKMDKVEVFDSPEGKRCRVSFTELEKSYEEKEAAWNFVHSTSA